MSLVARCQLGSFSELHSLNHKFKNDSSIAQLGVNYFIVLHVIKK